MLHSIQEICELSGESRSAIYGMLNEGTLSYVVGKDGKRKVETSELLRVFPKLNIPGVEHSSAPISSKTTDKNHKQEIYELRGMINDLRQEINNVLDDNRRLLRLLEHQTLHNKAARPPATEIAQHGWKNYKEMRESGVGEDKKPGFMDRINSDGGIVSIIKDFFFGR